MKSCFLVLIVWVSMLVFVCGCVGSLLNWVMLFFMLCMWLVLICFRCLFFM